MQRVRLDVTGAVQGVGFRPFVWRLASTEGLGGFVRNTGDGVAIEIEGDGKAIGRFLRRLEAEMPPHAAIGARRAAPVAPSGERDFVVQPSTRESMGAGVVMADLATCADCLREIMDPGDRRYRYPFTSCVNCGPRYSVIEALPYDRARTTMRHFPMCAACRAEYEDPACRRFRAEPIACPECGPALELWDHAGRVIAARTAALEAAAEAVRRGMILALKGLGGFQLLADAANEDAVRRLRAGKGRPRKPFALMFPSLAAIEKVARVGEAERLLLTSPEAPIVLLSVRPGAEAALAPSVAPGNSCVGAMLPYTPLHHLLFKALGFAVVASSGNRGDEPIVADEGEVRERLGGIADFLLVHDRPIRNAVDDSVVRVMGGREVVLRRARGYAPLPIACASVSAPVLALGGQQKSAVATGHGGQLFLGPHIGELSSSGTRAAFARQAADLPRLHLITPARVAADLHPDYHSTRMADSFGLPVARVPHHLAHVLGGMIDNELTGPVLGVAWDGTGYGGDGTIWGGEFLAVDDESFRRAASLLPFRLPGGEAAVREPRRSALGALHAIFGDDAPAMNAFTSAERAVLATMLRRGVHAPLTSSAGRLFDAVASLLDLRQVASFEGEAAMAVEFAAGRADRVEPLPAAAICEEAGLLVVDWRPMVAGLVEARARGSMPEALAAGVHEGLAAAIVAVAKRVGRERVVLSGGCFQNALLTELTIERLRKAGFVPFWHRRIPPNDGGLAAGQALFAARPLIEEKM